MNLQGIHCIVVGLGESGLPTALWLHQHGARVTAADSRSAPPALAALRAALPEVELRLGAFNDATFADAQLIVTSPGVAISHPALQAASARGVEVIGDVELLARTLDGKPGKVIAITGSNGKSTVTTMVGAICEAAGLHTVVAGNIGLPVLQALSECEASGRWPDVWVLELSSFQLETTSSLRAVAATVLNLSEDHLDRYPGMAEYAAAKFRIFDHTDTILLNHDDEWCRRLAPQHGKLVWFGMDNAQLDYNLRLHAGEHVLFRGEHSLMNAAALPVAGLHNALNALAAIALCHAAGIDDAVQIKALSQFKGLPHRVEFVAEIDGVRYYDDSKGTNVGATEAALKGMTQPVVLIAGGDGKGQDFSPLLPACERICRAVVLIGRDAPLLAETLNEARSELVNANDEGEAFLPVLQVPTLEMAVSIASNLAEAGDVVLLSPACASLDMFRNYHHRAEVFIAAVKALEH